MLPRLSKSIRFFTLAAGAVFMTSAAHAELSINPYPLGYNSSKAKSELRSSVAVPQNLDPYKTDHMYPDHPASDSPVSIVQPNGIAYPAPAQAVPVSPAPVQGVWRAYRGADLREVLGTWSQANNVALIWNLEDHYEVRETLTVQDTYENAVAALLSQYNNLYIRPVGSLHVAPGGQGQTLVVFNYEGS